MAELHFVVNGVDQGVFESDIPYSTEPLYVVVDVYGCTKKVCVVQVRSEGKNNCSSKSRDRNRCRRDDVMMKSDVLWKFGTPWCLGRMDFSTGISYLQNQIQHQQLENRNVKNVSP